MSEIVQVQSEAGLLINLYAYQLKFWESHAKKGLYQPRNLQAFHKLFSYFNPRTVIDVGAHIGFNTMQYAKIASVVHSFEPCDDTRTLLIRNILDNHITNVCTYGYALSDITGLAGLRTFKSNDGCNHLVFVNQSMEYALKHDAVKVYSLDDCPMFTDSQVDFIKIDVEGLELNVIRGGLNLIDRCRPAIQTEVVESQFRTYGYNRNVLKIFMTGIGYHPYSYKLEPVRDFENFPFGDVFWLHEDEPYVGVRK
jgi:FkbM family methyltransferase